MAELYGRDIRTLYAHLLNIDTAGELDPEATPAHTLPPSSRARTNERLASVGPASLQPRTVDESAQG